MKNAARPHRQAEHPVQLTLLSDSELPARFRLNRETRERGLRHVAEIRQQLAERRAARDRQQHHRLPPRRAA